MQVRVFLRLWGGRPSLHESRRVFHTKTEVRAALKEGPIIPVRSVPEGWTWAWRHEAACRGEDSSLFFAPNYFEKRGEKEAREAKAKAICARCPVREPCLEYALRIREPHGIWGGLNEFERRQLIRTRALAVS